MKTLAWIIVAVLATLANAQAQDIEQDTNTGFTKLVAPSLTNQVLDGSTVVETVCFLNGGTPIVVGPNKPCPPNDYMGSQSPSVIEQAYSVTGIATSPPDIYGCLLGEERVFRSDFSVGCAKDVHPQQWH